MERCILFVEVPGFYAAVERSEDPALAARPVIVGGDPRKRGRVQAATPDAREAGVEDEMPVLEALRLCPQARSVRTDMQHYREVSRDLMALMRSVLPRLEAFGLAAAYADLSDRDDAEQCAADLCSAAHERLALPLRAGIASGKFLARLAAEEMPDQGVHRIPNGDEHAFLAPLPVTRLDGVGQKTAARLAEIGVHTIGEVLALGRARLQEIFGVHGVRIYHYAAGEDTDSVGPGGPPRSMSRESTVHAEPRDLSVLVEHLTGLAERLETELTRQGLAARKVTLKLRFADSGRTTRTRTLSDPVDRALPLAEVAQSLLSRTQAGARPIRGIGLQLAGLSRAGDGDRQLVLFPDDE